MCVFTDGVSRHRSPLVGEYVCNVRPASGRVGRGESGTGEVIHVGRRQHHQRQVQPSRGVTACRVVVVLPAALPSVCSHVMMDSHVPWVLRHYHSIAATFICTNVPS